jgi:hypothetical protein
MKGRGCNHAPWCIAYDGKEKDIPDMGEKSNKKLTE